MKHDSTVFLLTAILVILAFSLALTSFLLFQKASGMQIGIDDQELKQLNWSVPDGFVKVDLLRVEGNVVAVGKDCTAIIAQTSPERAEALQNAIAEKIGERPDVYEGFADVLRGFNVTLEAVLIHKFDAESYYSDGIFRVGDRILQLDMKPSDAMTVALRANASIYINATLLEKMGKMVC